MDKYRRTEKGKKAVKRANLLYSLRRKHDNMRVPIPYQKDALHCLLFILDNLGISIEQAFKIVPDMDRLENLFRCCFRRAQGYSAPVPIGIACAVVRRGLIVFMADCAERKRRGQKNVKKSGAFNAMHRAVSHTLNQIGWAIGKG